MIRKEIIIRIVIRNNIELFKEVLKAIKDMQGEEEMKQMLQREINQGEEYLRLSSH